MCARARYTHIGYIAKFQFFHIRKILEKGNLRKKWKIIYEKILEMRNGGSAAFWNFFPHPSTPVAFSNAALPAQIFPRGRRANSCSPIP